MENTKLCAEKILEVVPEVMNALRAEMRQRAKFELTVPQFRVLARLNKNPTTSSDLADWIGVSLPSISKMIEILVKRELVKRNQNQQDRRETRLELTAKGENHFLEIKKSAQESFAKKIAALSIDDRQKLMTGLSVLDSLKYEGER